MDSVLHAYGDLFQHGRCFALKKGEVLHRPDEYCEAMGLVLDGEIRLSRMLSTGREISIKSFRPGDIFAELIVFTGEEYPGWLTAAAPSRIVEVGLPCVLEYLEERHALISYISGIAGKMNHMNDMIEVLSFKTVRQKIAYSLLYGKTGDVQRKDSENGYYRINITSFASFLNCSREALSRALSQMESDGLLSRVDGTIIIEDSKGLESLL